MSSETVPPTTAKDDGKNATNTAEPESSAISQPDAKKSVSDQRKKRRSDVQINKDDHPDGDGSEDDGDLNDEGEKRSDPFKRASDDVLKKRKIVKASSKWGGGATASSGGGAFASVKLTASNKTVPSFGNTSSSSSKKGGFGSGFGAVSQGFGAVSASTASTGFGSTSVSNNTGFGGKSEEKDKSSDTAETKPSVFGGGFGAVSSGFGAVKSGFAAASSATTSSGFGSTVTSTEKSTNGHDDAKGKDDQDKSGGASSSKKDSSDENAKDTTTDTAQSNLFPTTTVVDVNNGEENEECLCQVIAKLYKMVPDIKEPEGTAMEKGDVPSVPSSSGRFGDVKQNDNNGTATTNSEEENVKKDEKGASGSKLVRKEAGVGNVRVLKRKSLRGDEKNENKSLGRVVQRQRGSNTLILNIRLIPKQCKVTRPGEKFVQLNAPSKDGTLESFLFRVKTAEDSDNLVKHLESMLEDVTNKA